MLTPRLASECESKRPLGRATCAVDSHALHAVTRRHYATYQAAVNGFATRKQLGKQRKELYGKFLTGKAKPKAIESGFGAGFPKRRSYLGGAIVYDEVQNSWLLPFFFADPASEYGSVFIPSATHAELT